MMAFRSGTRVFLLITIFLNCVLCLFVIVGLVEEQQETMVELGLRMQGPLAQDDPSLLEKVRTSFLQEPSSLEYNLIEDESSSMTIQYHMHRCCSWAWYQKIVKALYNEQPPGFFVEAGAHDGEFISNTLYLERNLGWTGLLVEVDGELYKKLLKKNRKAWTSKCCLATLPYPHQAILGKISNSRKKNLGKSTMGALLGTKDIVHHKAGQGFSEYNSVQCIPLYSLLKSIGRAHADLISLDVEDSEMGVLSSLPWQKMTVDVWMIEHRSGNLHWDQASQLDSEFVSWFESLGYSLYALNEEYADYVFIRNGTSVHNRAFTLHNGKFKSNLVI